MLRKQALFETIEDDPLYPVVKITALYGLRRSEVLGLKWDSVDFTTGRLTIKRTVSKLTTSVCKDKTKTATPDGVTVCFGARGGT